MDKVALIFLCWITFALDTRAEALRGNMTQGKCLQADIYVNPPQNDYYVFAQLLTYVLYYIFYICIIKNEGHIWKIYNL